MDRIKEYLEYDPTTGIFIRLKSRSGSNKIGSAVGSLNCGYIIFNFNGVVYSAHRVAWYFTYGAIPEGRCIDHINGKKSDNRLCNLRLATRLENGQNIHPLQVNNTSGYRGVHKQKDRWIAKIKVRGKQIYLGYFSTVEEANKAYIKAKKELHPFWVENKELNSMNGESKMSEEKNNEQFLTEAEVSKILGLSRQTLLKLRKEGALDTYRQGGKSLLYSADNVRAYLSVKNAITKQPINQSGE